MDTLIEQHILNGDTDAATTVRQIKQREDQRAMHRRINSSVKASRSKGVTSTIVPSTGTTGVKQFHFKADVERENLKYMSSLLVCADDTPLRQPPLLGDLGYIGDTSAGDAITNCNYRIPEGVDEYTTLFLNCCAKPGHVLSESSTV